MPQQQRKGNKKPPSTFHGWQFRKQQNYCGTSLQQPRNLLQGFCAKERAIQEFELEPSLTELERMSLETMALVAVANGLA